MTEPADPGAAVEPDAERPDFSPLDRVGLNLHVVLPMAALDAASRERLAAKVELARWRQILVVANGGPELWRSVRASGVGGEDPIDRFSTDAVVGWLAAQRGAPRGLLLYPGEPVVDLQALGRAAGWHQASPLMLGLHPHWGSWFGYRVVMLTDTDWATNRVWADMLSSVCARCATTPCVTACPAGAVGTRLDLARCIAHRLQPDSACTFDCAARLACPVGAQHRYDEGQRRHSYAASLAAIRRYRKAGA